jgi:non-structural maintenance of chromosomes element 1
MSDHQLLDYNDSHRAFLQAFLAQNVLTFESAKPTLAAIFSAQEGKEIIPDDISLTDLESYVSTANNALSPLDLEIRTTFHQIRKERVYALVNNTSDPLTQLATTYNADEIAFVKRLLDAMFDGPANNNTKEAMCLSTMDAVQLGRGGNRRETQNGISQAAHSTMRIDEAEAMLEKLNIEGWLEKSRSGFHTLSPRALMELKGWLVETYNEPAEDGEQSEEVRRDKIKFCHACKEIITMVCPMSHAPDLGYRTAPDTETRDSVALTASVPAVYTIYVRRTSSACSGRRLVLSARPHGMGRVM